MSIITLDNVLENAMQLPYEQQEMLLDILYHRHIAQERSRIAQDAQESLRLYRADQFTPQPISEILAELDAIADEELA